LEKNLRIADDQRVGDVEKVPLFAWVIAPTLILVCLRISSLVLDLVKVDNLCVVLEVLLSIHRSVHKVVDLTIE